MLALSLALVAAAGCGGGDGVANGDRSRSVNGRSLDKRKRTSLTGTFEVIGRDTRGVAKTYRMITDDGWEVWLEGSSAQRMLPNFTGRRVKVTGDLGKNEFGGYKMFVHQAAKAD